jgi:outer membrane protein assembly factor BamD
MFQTFINTHPGSAKNKEANDIIDQLRLKLEAKDRKSAQLYYDIGQFRAAAVAFNTMLNDFAESERAPDYKLMAIKAYFRFAELSVEEKKAERFEKVVQEAEDFMDRFPDSPLSKDVQDFVNKSKNNLKIYANEPAKTTT